MIEVLHVIPSFTRGGAGRSLLELCRHSAPRVRDRIITLAAGEPAAVGSAQAMGINVSESPDPVRMAEAVTGSDLIVVHYWNSPEMYRFLNLRLPATRILLWLKVHGSSPPQVLTPDLMRYADGVLATSPSTCRLPEWRARADTEPAAVMGVAPGLADFSRLAGIRRRGHDGFRVGYIGTVDFVKMHADYVRLHDTIDIPDAQFVVCGTGNAVALLKRQCAALPHPERFHLRGYVDDIRAVLEEIDVFGYPLCRDTYATSEKSLQEAMFAGVPPVVFPHGGVPDVVTHGETGLIVGDAAQYRAAIEFLYNNPSERRRIGDNAAAHARRAFEPTASVDAIHRAYDALAAMPLRVRCFGDGVGDGRGAAGFLQSLGPHAGPFAISYAGGDSDDVVRAELAIGRSSPVLCSAGGGGLLHYRRQSPDDAHLRLWAGLVMREQGRPALALAEFLRARDLGCDSHRVSAYVLEVARAVGADALAADAQARLDARACKAS